MNSALCAFTLTKAQLGQNSPKFDLKDVLSIQFVTIDLLDSGVWPVVGWMSPIDFHSAFDLEKHRSNQFVGTKICGSGNIINFLNACFGLEPWDDWYDPQALDGYLLTPRHKPPLVVYKNEVAKN